MALRELNRLRIILAERNKKNKWLAEQLNVNVNTVSKWINNIQQPTLNTFYEISVLLDVDLRELFISTKSK